MPSAAHVELASDHNRDVVYHLMQEWAPSEPSVSYLPSSGWEGSECNQWRRCSKGYPGGRRLVEKSHAPTRAAGKLTYAAAGEASDGRKKGACGGGCKGAAAQECTTGLLRAALIQRAVRSAQFKPIPNTHAWRSAAPLPKGPAGVGARLLAVRVVVAPRGARSAGRRGRAACRGVRGGVGAVGWGC